MMAQGTKSERGQVIVIFALLFPVIMAIGAMVITIGNWYTHAKHLQTKVDAAAFAGGGVWAFPCAADSDTNANGTGIVDQARQFVGPHTTAAGTVLTTGFNPQIGGVGANDIHVILNGTGWWDDDAGTNPADFTTPNGSVCNGKILDVRATEANSFPLFSLIPLFPDIKRKARVEIQEIEGLRGLLPIAVRVPKPLSAAAIFYDEGTGTIKDVKYFSEVCTPAVPTCLPGAPPGLGQWTTPQSAGNWATYTASPKIGVAIGMSFRPACGTPGATAPCFEDSGFGTVNSLCNQAGGIVQCFYATGSGASQTVRSGLQFIQGYRTGSVTDGPPDLRSVWFDTPSANCGAYFSSVTGSCSANLNVNLDIGTAPGRINDDQHVEVRYKLVAGNTADADDDPPGACGNNYNNGCGLNPSWSTSVTFDPAYARHAIAIRVRLAGTQIGSGPGAQTCPPAGSFNANCQWFFTAQGPPSTNTPTDAEIFANPVQRSFMGNIDRSGAVKWLRLSTDIGCDGAGVPNYSDGRAASVPPGTHCSYVEMGLQGGLAKDQDEPPIQLNLGVTSQASVLDCDPNIPNIKQEIQTGCLDPPYAANKFNTAPLCPGNSQFFVTPKASPFDDWPPFDCVLTQTTAAANQIMEGFNLRFFGVQNNPNCPNDPGTSPPPPDGPWAKGRNYWHNDNNQNDNYTFADNGVGYGVPDPNPLDNKGNRLLPAEDDPRLVTLFFAPYDSFTGTGNEVYPVVGFGNFYITGYGRVLGNGSLVIEDPCSNGNDGNLYNGNGNEPPPDLDTSTAGAIAWGHFVKSVTPNPFTTGGNGVLCEPELSFQPCVAVLVE